MGYRMLKLNVVILSIIILVSCSTNTDPIDLKSSDYDVYITPTGKSDGNYVEFKFINTSDHIVWYLGFGEESPIYLGQTLSDSGWVSYIWWKCLTGAEMYTLASHKSIRTNVRRPQNDVPWRIGLWTRRDSDEEDYYSWSAVQN